MYVVRDVQTAVFRVWVFIKWSGIPFLFGLYIMLTGITFLNCPQVIKTAILSFYGFAYIFLLIKIYFANLTYKINTENNLFTCPAVDISNSIIAFIILVPFFKLFWTQDVDLRDIEGVYLDTQRWSTTHGEKGKKYTKKHARYNLSVTGSFGSQSLTFLSRQKRDEVRNALIQGMKHCGKKNIRQDIEVA